MTGINVKLEKVGGLRAALTAILAAKRRGNDAALTFSVLAHQLDCKIVSCCVK